MPIARSRAIFAIFAGGLLLSAPPALAADGPIELGAKLRSCTPGSASQPHPLMRGFVIEHVVAGQRDGRCQYSQTMPGGMRMLCAFDEAAGAAYADELERSARTGAISGSSQDAKPAWSKACEIETRDGKRLPMGG